MKNREKIITSVRDLAMLQMIIIVLAFNDYSNLSIISQMIAFFIVLITEIMKDGKITGNIGKYIISKIMFVGMCAASSIWAVNKSNITALCVAILLRIVTGFTIIIYLKDEKTRKKFLKYLICSGIIFCVRMLMVVPVSAWGTQRIGIYLAHNKNNSYGYTGVTYVLGIMATLILTDFEIFKSKKLRYFIVIIFTIFSLLSGSKKQIFMTVISILLFAFLGSKNAGKAMKNLCKVSAILIILGVMIFKIDALYNVIGTRLLAFLNIGFETSVEMDASTISRENYSAEAWKVFKGSPIVGVGIDCFKYKNSFATVWAENNILELLADLGVIGIILYYFIHTNIIISIMKRIKNKNKEDIQIFITLICLMIIDFSMVSYSSSILQFYLAYVYALNEIERIKIKNKEVA